METAGVVHSILEGDAIAAARSLEATPPGAAFVELRADVLRADEVAALVRRSPLPAIVAVRSRDVATTRANLEAALAAGAAFVDVALDGELSDLAEGAHAARVILSHHGGACTLGAMTPLLDRMAASRAARLKIVPEAQRASELGALRALLARGTASGKPVAAFASGPAGSASRVMALAWGSWATYGAAAAGRESAPGQQTSRELVEVYRAHRIGAATARYLLVGSPVAASPSPALHAAAFAANGLDAVTLPVVCDDPGDVPSLVEAFAPAGLAVTMPFKESLARRCDRLDHSARHGAVNTIRIDGSGWTGFNTDAPAALALLARTGPLAGVAVAVVGSGGTARAVGGALVEAGARVTLHARDLGRASEVAAAIGAASAPLDRLPLASWEILVQATPLGRKGERVIPDDRLRGRAVLDAVYAHEPTPLIVAARARGLTVIDGYDLLLAQALLQFEILTGRPAQAVAMAAALDAFRGAA